MTMSNDMSSLFPDIIQCMSIPQLEIKKMCFLYLVNYARLKPEMAIEALQILLKDLKDNNPLVRALAMRTMSYIHVRQVNAAMVEPLRSLLQDEDPYVRKTAAMCVAKLHGHDRRLVDDESKLLFMLRDLLGDSNSTVVANALAALMDICDRTEGMKLNLNTNLALKVITAMNECSEWSQTYILESLMSYVPQIKGDAEIICERIAPRLQHNNAGIVLTTIKLILYLTNYIDNQAEVLMLYRKMSPPLVTLLAKGPEIQFVALRNIELIVQKAPEVLRNEVKVFFCKYNDPIYVKLAKLEIIVKLAESKNIEQVLTELQEYATEVDVDFVRKAVRSIGRVAIKIEEAASKCIDVLLEIVSTKVTYVVQEAIVVIRDIFRKYPGRYESIISTLCENLDNLDESEAKAAMIWIVGQYADRIDTAGRLLADFASSFTDETAEVQLALLTATVKLFILRPAKGQDLVPKVLKWATEDVDNPDVRDRGFMYWRLLSSDLQLARRVVLGQPGQGRTIALQSDNFDPKVLEELCLNLASLSSIYHKVPSALLRHSKTRRLTDSPVLQHRDRPSLQRQTTLDAAQMHKSQVKDDILLPNTITTTRNPYADFMQMNDKYTNTSTAGIGAEGYGEANLIDL